MFTVNTNYDIKMSIGDAAQFPLFLNIGTRAAPISYKFEKNDGCEIYFYLIDPDNYKYDYDIKKTITTSGTIVTERFWEEEPIIETGKATINANNNLVIKLEPEDTENLMPKNYLYQVKAKVRCDKVDNSNLVIDPEDEYITLTVTNKYNFYLIDDKFNRAW